MTAITSTIAFDLPRELEAKAPPPRRDAVRLLVAGADGIRHAQFADLGDYLHEGDLVVVNTSATLAAAVDARRGDGRPATVHFSTALDGGDWVVEVRPAGRADGPVDDAQAGEQLVLPDGVRLRLITPHPADQPTPRLWQARLDVDGGVVCYLERHGRPITYSYVHGSFPLADYQTVFARQPGSAEMPSAARPFTTELVTRLVSRGIAVAPISLHTGVSSQEVGEPPLPERFSVPGSTARLVNLTRHNGGRVVAVGTTVTRALETVVDSRGEVQARAGWTDVVLGPDRPARVVTGLVTGWHAPGASHLQLLQAVAGHDLVEHAYAAALSERYLWHEFGDSALLLP